MHSKEHLGCYYKAGLAAYTMGVRMERSQATWSYQCAADYAGGTDRVNDLRRGSRPEQY